MAHCEGGLNQSPWVVPSELNAFYRGYWCTELASLCISGYGVEQDTVNSHNRHPGQSAASMNILALKMVQDKCGRKFRKIV